MIYKCSLQIISWHYPKSLRHRYWIYINLNEEGPEAISCDLYREGTAEGGDSIEVVMLN